MNKIMTAIALACVMLLLLCGCSELGREYNDDITVMLPGRDGVLVIREWSFLTGSGAEVYYRYGWQSPVLLGQTSGADDGYCPFAAGEYRVTQEGDAVRLSWRFSGTGAWRTETFDLPDDAMLRRQSIVAIAVAAAAVLALGTGAVFGVRYIRRRKNQSR